MGFEMIFQGFQPSDEQIEDLEQGNPINDAEHLCDAEQQRQQHLQQQQWQQDVVTRTLRYCTQHGLDEEHSGEEHEHFGEEDNEEYKEEHKEEHKEEKDDEQKLSPNTQERSQASDGADSLSSTNANDPPTDATEEKTDAAEVPQEGTDHPDHPPATVSAVTEDPQDATTNSAAADSAPTANEPKSAAKDPIKKEVDTIHTSDYTIYNLMASHILFPMPNNPTYQHIYHALQDYIPDMEQREQAPQLLQEIAIV
jgi:hypothetical protein